MVCGHVEKGLGMENLVRAGAWLREEELGGQ